MRMPGKTLVLLAAMLSVLVAAPLVYASSRDTGNRWDRGRDDPRWALVDETGAIVQQTGGFEIVDCFRTNANCYVDINEDATKEGLGATIAGQNAVAGQAVSLTGEIGAGACGSATLACAPPGTENRDVVVVSPRNSDGSSTAPGARKRFYLEVIGPDAQSR